MFIPVRPMLSQVDVKGPEDDWTGVSSTAERRKIQNRLHQRSYRRRHRKKQVVANATIPLSENVSDSPSCADLGVRNCEGSKSLVRFSERSPIQLGTLCNMDPTTVQLLINHYEIWASKSYMQHSLDADNLFTLVNFNVFRALHRNSYALGINMEWMKCDASSPFNSMDDPDFSCTPPLLCPSAMQRTVPHHPWIDLFPFPVMRDNILRAGEDYDDTELCIDLVEFCNVAGDADRTGLVVWGEPSDPYSWEVSEGFAKKWAWVISGCWDLFESTNYWRARRGEKKLFLK
ncbi:hypothetical protein V1509DRAFT_424058 [Lipomyces kononenkoae]